MLLEIYLISIFFMAFLAFLWPRADSYSAILLAIIVSLVCGFRGDGFDYEEYLSMISGIRSLSSEGFLIAFLTAKDPGIAAVVIFSTWISDTDIAVFLSMAILGFLPKVFVALLLPKNKTLFVALYALFLAPGLEFAALRSAVGIGFLGLAILAGFAVYVRSVLFLCSVVFHASLLPGVLLLFKRYWSFSFSHFWFTPLIALLILLIGNDLIKIVFESRGARPGTIFAPFFPLITLGGIFFFTRQRFVFATKNESDRYRRSIVAAVLFAAMALVMAMPLAVTAIRLLEISYFFILFAIVITAARNRLNALSLLAVSFFIIVLVITNTSRMTWAVMAQTSFG